MAANSIGPISKVLLQVDLEGHSRWMASMSTAADASADRIALAELLHAQLSKKQFKLLSWKGDGGVYTADPIKANLDFAVEAAKNAADAFSSWRSKKANRSLLRMRISAHLAPDLYVHEESGYWSSDHLNLFLKYEREIGLSGTLAATDALFRHLSGNMQKQFTYHRERALGLAPGEPLIRQVHYLRLKREVQLSSKAKGSFIEWLSDLGAPTFIDSDVSIGPRAQVRGSVGDAALLFGAPAPDSQIRIELTEATSAPALKLSADLESRWRELQEVEVRACREQLREDGRKVSPVSLLRPLTDVPLATLEWRPELWSRTRSFHQLLRERPDLWKASSERFLALHEEPLAIPGIVCCHFVVRTGSGHSPAVLLCQRQFKGPKDSYHPGSWSISFEEQVKPGESIHETIQRGLNEEVLGVEGSVGASTSVLAAFVEKSILNVSILVLVDVPHSLEDIVRFWQRVPDKDEHRQLASLTLSREVLAELAEHQALSPAVRGRLTPSHPEVFIHDCQEQTANWSLHPTSLIRAAAALWVQEASTARAV